MIVNNNNNSVSMAKQLYYYSEVHLINIEIYLSTLHIGTYYKVHNVLKCMLQAPT